MKIQEQTQGAVAVLKPAGPLSQDDAKSFKEQVVRNLGNNLGRFVVDMSEIPFVDSAGLEALVDITEQLSQSGRSLKLCAANKTVREVLHLTNLAGQFDLFEDVNTAVRSFL
jgi:anti-sigma B factor antagonist